MRFDDRYAAALRSSKLRGDADKTLDIDVIGAAGYAGKNAPLAVALLRLLLGSGSPAVVVEVLASACIGRAFHRERRKIGAKHAADMARAVVAWHRDGRCLACDGLGLMRHATAPVLTERECKRCHGTGKRPFDSQFPLDDLDLARWLLAEVERETTLVGPLAMAAIAPRMDL